MKSVDGARALCAALRLELSSREQSAERLGRNGRQLQQAHSLWSIVVRTFIGDRILILLAICSTASIVLGGLQHYFGSGPPHNSESLFWLEGAAILVAIAAVVLGNGVNDWLRGRQFTALDKCADSVSFVVVEQWAGEQDSHDLHVMAAHDLVVGDVIHVKPGDILHADGVLLSGKLLVDESQITGEADAVQKPCFDDVISGTEHGQVSFALTSGSRVCDGSGRMLVLAVGQSSFYGRMASAQAATRPDQTPLQKRLNALAETIARAGLFASTLYFVALVCVDVLKGTNYRSLHRLLKHLTSAVALIAASVPEGLPMAVAMALAAATRRLLAERALVRVLSACEVMGASSVICTDKTGTLTAGHMAVVRCLSCAEHEARHGFRATDLDSDRHSIHLIEGLAVNSTAFLDLQHGGWIGSGTETAILLHLIGNDASLLATIRKSKVLCTVPFSSDRKWMATAIEKYDGIKLHIKGGVDILLPKCQHYKDNAFGPELQSEISTITSQAGAMRFLAACCCTVIPEQLESFLQLKSLDTLSNMELLGVFALEDPLRPDVAEVVASCRSAGVAVTLVTGDALSTAVGVANTCGIITHPSDIAIDASSLSSVISGDISVVVQPVNSKSCANQSPKVTANVSDDAHQNKNYCGVQQTHGTVSADSSCKADLNADLAIDDGKSLLVNNSPTGKTLNAMQHYLSKQNYSASGVSHPLERLRVVARATPFDKQRLIEALRARGHVVAVTGDGANDGPALKAADVSFSMGGSRGTDAARAASTVVLMDDSFATIVRAMAWGRAVVDNVQRFLQFQLAVNISSVTVSLGCVLLDQNAVLSPVQLLWVNLIMDSLAAVAFAFEGPTADTLCRPPTPVSADILTQPMRRMVAAQAVYSTAVSLCVSYFFPHAAFNTFVLVQLANELNCRALGDGGLSPLRGLGTVFACIWLGTLVAQVAIVFTIPSQRLDPVHWAVSVIAALLVLPIGLFVRLVGRSMAPGGTEPASSVHAARLRRAVHAVQASGRLHAALRHASRSKSVMH